MPSCLLAYSSSSTSPQQQHLPSCSEEEEQHQQSSCRYKSCHGGYSHTLEYFPNSLEQHQATTTSKPIGNGFTFPLFSPRLPSSTISSADYLNDDDRLHSSSNINTASSCSRRTKYDDSRIASSSASSSSPSQSSSPSTSSSSGKQKRCWKTANYEWMNIKRRHGSGKSSDKGGALRDNVYFWDVSVVNGVVNSQPEKSVVNYRNRKYSSTVNLDWKTTPLGDGESIVSAKLPKRPKKRSDGESTDEWCTKPDFC